MGALKTSASSFSVQMPVDIDLSYSTKIEVDCKTWLLEPCDIIELDFKLTEAIAPNSYRAFVALARLARDGQKKMVSINVPPFLERQLKADGVSGIFNVQSATAAPAPAPKGSTVLDVTLINPFIQATVQTFKVQAQTESLPGKPYLLTVDEKSYDPPIGIVGLITLATPNFNGTIALVLSEKVFLKIYENMFGEKHESISAELQDAAAEILNIIYGTAKTELKKNPKFDLQPAIPTILAGANISLRQKTLEKLIILPFESDAGPFQMEIAVDAKVGG